MTKDNASSMGVDETVSRSSGATAAVVIRARPTRADIERVVSKCGAGHRAYVRTMVCAMSRCFPTNCCGNEILGPLAAHASVSPRSLGHRLGSGPGGRSVKWWTMTFERAANTVLDIAGASITSTVTGSTPTPSDRKQAVLRRVAEGLLNTQIATWLGIAERTVKAHLTSAMRKLEVDTRAHAADTAVKRGLL